MPAPSQDFLQDPAHSLLSWGPRTVSPSESQHTSSSPPPSPRPTSSAVRVPQSERGCLEHSLFACFLTLPTDARAGRHQPHFLDEETQAQRSEPICFHIPSPLGKSMAWWRENVLRRGPHLFAFSLVPESPLQCPCSPVCCFDRFPCDTL